MALTQTEPAAVSGSSLPFTLLHSSATEGTNVHYQYCHGLNGGRAHITLINKHSFTYIVFIIHIVYFSPFSVLSRLIAVTDRGCDTGNNMVSPIYLAVISNQYQCVEVLLKEGFSPDAQDCSDILGLSSPLSLALSSTSHKPFR